MGWTSSSEAVPQPLTATEFEIPQRSGDVLCLPAAREFLSVAEANASLLGAADVRIAGVPLPEVRQRARAAALAESAAYARELGIAGPRPSGGTVLIGTGHQPFLFHPGIWSKHLLADRFSADAVVVNMPVDCDAAEDVGADAPHLDGGLSIVHETLVRVDPDVPYEAIEAPGVADWTAFLERLDSHLRTLPHRGTHDVFGAFMNETRHLSAPDIGSFLTLARRRHEGESGYAELPVSRLSQGAEFRRFFLHILRQADAFVASYNRHLEMYRERFNVRTPAQPFPNLERDGPRVELPFWVIRDGRRRPLFVERDRGGFRLWAGEQAAAVVRGVDLEEIATLALRPRALALTAFTRLCVVDLFVHGVGGGRYDRVTDAVIRDFFGLTPPRYAVVSATLHLPLSEFDPTEERAALQRRLLELQHNPERVLGSPTDDQRRWIDEKWQLIGRLDAESLTRRDRREATRRIREINDHLAAALMDERRTFEHRFSALQEISQASEAATHRGYPFCFFPRRAVEELVTAMVAGHGGP